MNDTQEAKTIEAMHTGDYTGMLPPEPAVDDRVAPLSAWMQAVGLLTTLCPTLVMDSRDPVGMAKQIEAHVLAEKKRVDAAEAECEEWRANYGALEAVAIASERGRMAAEGALAAVPLAAIDYVTSVADYPFGCGKERAAIAAWLAERQQPAVQP